MLNHHHHQVKRKTLFTGTYKRLDSSVSLSEESPATNSLFGHVTEFLLHSSLSSATPLRSRSRADSVNVIDFLDALVVLLLKEPPDVVRSISTGDQGTKWRDGLILVGEDKIEIDERGSPLK